MQSVVRSSFVFGAFAFAAATALTACGDKVNVQGPQLDSVVHSVTVSPASVPNMKIGDKVTLAASVDAGSGVSDRTVQWSSSNVAVVTVDQNGVVTAVAGGTASVIAKATANPSVQGAAVITVGANVNATVTISSVNQTTCGTAGCTSSPANIANITGQIDVTLNVDPGTQTLTGVDLIMNCTGPGNSGADTVVASQNLGADKAPIGGEEAAAPVQLSFNTASFNATTGAVAFRNGTCTLKGRARTAAGTQSGANTETLVLANPDVIIGTMTSTKSATAPGGLAWHGGDVTVSIIPVFFTANRSAVSEAITFQAKTFNASSGGPQSATFIDTNDPASTNALDINNITNVNSQNTLVVTTVDNSGNQFQNPGGIIVTAQSYLANPGGGGTAPFNALNPFRLDTQKPVPGTIALANNADQGTTGSGYIGASFRFAADSAAGYRGPDAIPGNQTQNLDHGGVDNATVVFQQGTSATSSFTAVTNTNNLSETVSATTNVLRQITTDALGNADTSYANGTPFPNGNTVPAAAKFGVDKTPPTFTLTSGPLQHATAQAVSSGGVGGTGSYVVNIGDALSGPGVTQLVAQVRQNSGVTTTSALPANGAVFTNGSENNIATAGCVIGRFNTTQAAAGANALPVVERGGTTVGFCTPTPYLLTGGTTVSANFGTPALEGYSTTEIVAIDQAGNTAAPFVNTVLEDATNPTAGPGVDLPQSIAGGSAPVFPTLAADNLDVVASFAQITYPSGMVLEGAVAAGTGTAFDNVLTRSTTVTPGVAVFARNLQTSGNPSTLTAGSAAATAPASVNVVVLDAASRAGATGAINFSPTVAISQPSSNPWSSNFTAGFSITSNAAGGLVTNCPASGCGPSGTTTPVNPTTVTFTATAAGVSALLGNPFTTVQIWYQVGAGPWFLAGTTGAGSSRDTGVGGNRFWDFTFTWDPPAAAQPDQTGAIASLAPPNAGSIGINVMAIGMNANGDALFTAPLVITLTNP
jgi:hypothetical protein